ncbi:hypothetical protein XA3_18390 [Xylocopilactobacillus apicola]|uniref:Uncharacterized protein n=1 Tax=Xylocopilactobacillus apicola TaxID=2932184 RepID=A0AAU9D789_9LACO|nr:hypothetical protein XA3_18390 [Xylocopilactobacillus apicola]
MPTKGKIPIIIAQVPANLVPYLRLISGYRITAAIKAIIEKVGKNAKILELSMIAIIPSV